jgi:tetratricopeptide (TPR) repeat protein
MVKNKNNIHDLHQPFKKEELKILDRLDFHLISGNFGIVIEETEKAILKYPGNRFFYILNSVAHLQINQNNQALQILKLAEEKFPKDYEVFFHLAKIHEELNDYPNAEKYYRKSYELTPHKFKDARSDCLNDLGALYWEINFRDKALEYWQLSVNENPKNTKAKMNLENCSNKYGEPEFADKLRNDINHFRIIQTEKYFKLKKIKEFSDMKEAAQILSIIQSAWNKHIVPDRDKLDTYPVEKINEWFRSIEPDFPK